MTIGSEPITIQTGAFLPEYEPTEFTTPGSDEQQAHLVAAGEAVRDWVLTRRATWAKEPLPAPAVVPPRPLAPPQAEGATDAWMARDAAPPRWPRMGALRTSVDLVREPLMLWSRRGAIAAGIAVMTVAAGWAVETRLSTWYTATRTGTVVLESVPPDSDILLDGKPIGRTPLTLVVPPGRHNVEFRRHGVVPRKLDVMVTAGQSTIGHIDWTAARTGRLQVRSNPAGASVVVDGRPRGVAPLTINDLATGSHTVVLESSNGSVQRNVEVSADNTTDLVEAIYSGWLHVSSSIDLEISEGTRGLQLDGQSNVLLAPGPHSLVFANQRFGYREVRQVVVNPGQTTAISVVAQASVLTIASTLPAEVFIDGERAGETPLSDHRVNLGTREITVRSRTGIERRFMITVGTQPTRLDVDFSKP
jgi:hypothetical protein